MPASNSTTRFSSRVSDYISSRPSYPSSIVPLLQIHFNLPQDAHIVDLGSGTGILSALFLRELESCPSLRVSGLEPNKDMREAGEELLQKDMEAGRFTSLDATAETTGLQDHSVDLILAGQAFHWFDVPKTRAECLRILKKGGHSGVALVWNDRRGVQDAPQRLAAAGEDINQVDYDKLDSPVTSAYELLLVKRGTDYKDIDHHRKVDKKALDTFFGPKGFKVKSFENPYKLTHEQLKGRLLSSSYTPQEGGKGHEEMMRELRELFDKFQKDGKVDFIYDTRVFYGELSE